MDVPRPVGTWWPFRVSCVRPLDVTRAVGGICITGIQGIVIKLNRLVIHVRVWRVYWLGDLTSGTPGNVHIIGTVGSRRFFKSSFWCLSGISVDGRFSRYGFYRVIFRPTWFPRSYLSFVYSFGIHAVCIYKRAFKSNGCIYDLSEFSIISILILFFYKSFISIISKKKIFSLTRVGTRVFRSVLFRNSMNWKTIKMISGKLAAEKWLKCW